MGRKKIEIKPLTDERNRNVTFLKRKAGLMKKAYELSVLCGVSVSLLIFSHNGKPYEFSSDDFDTEVDRYYAYEGTIERRRGAEFEAMAKAGEDDDDDEDEDDIKPGKAKLNGAPKSLKGKESFKARRMPPGDERRDRDRNRERPADETFVGGLVDDIESPPSPRRRDSADGLQYALGLHQQQAPQAQSALPQGPPGAPGMPWQSYRLGNVPFGFPFGGQGGGGPGFLPSSGGGPLGGVPSMPPGGAPWESNQMLTTYAWLQIQQAHQEQKRHLLEKQQQQLLELTSRSGGAALLRDFLGPTGGPPTGGVGSLGMPGSAALAAGTLSSGEFVWPTASSGDHQVSTPPDDDLVWALSGAGGNGMQNGGSGQGGGQFGVDYPITADGKRREPRDALAAAAAAKRRKQ